MFVVVKKLKHVKGLLKSLNRSNFADIEKACDVADLALKDIQEQLQGDPQNVTNLAAEREAMAHVCSLKQARWKFLLQKFKLDWLKEGDENSSFFHRSIKERQFRNKVLQIKDMNGVVCSDPNDIECAFVEYYKYLLGSSKPVKNIHVSIVHSGNCITPDHVQQLLKPVSSEEIKECLFSIPPNKAPGPDGYNSQFFKDAWSVVGKDVCEAIKDFFSSGQLLKQISNTSISLIPKVKCPSTVLDFRPIACCNTIYKCIAKLLCSRLGAVLPDIISKNQGGFIKDRHIAENILICQDLVRMYSRKVTSPRCLIKMDLRKAYDSVEWSFLFQMMEALGFPQPFLGWIKACVTSPSYTLSVNGNSFGFFQGKKGLRQGDLLSPLLFTICMEYLSRILGIVGDLNGFKFHPLCSPLKLNHLLFADDLLLFCKGDVSSIMLLLRSFASFSTASGLAMNREKSDIYFNGMTSVDMEDIMLVSGFRRGQLPFRYLGVPISAKKLSMKDGMKLIDKITARIRSWGAGHLTYSGRLVLTQAVLTSLHSYWMSVFLIPTGIVKKIDSICRNYLWNGSDTFKHAPNVKWDDCCYPKEEGGLGIRHSKDWNKAMLGKYIWWIEQKQDHLWVKWINHVYMKGVDWQVYSPPIDCAWSWKKIAHCMPLFQSGQSPVFHDDYSVKAAYKWIRGGKEKVSWRFVCWNSMNIPRCAFIYWEYKLGRLMTYDRLQRMGFTGNGTCLLCGSGLETCLHLFHDCCFAQRCWAELCSLFKVRFNSTHFEGWLNRGAGRSKLMRNVISACTVGLIYGIWTARNKTRVEQVLPCPKWLVKQIAEDVITRFKARNKSVLSIQDSLWIHNVLV